MRAHAEHGFQMLRMHEKAGELVAVQLQPEQHAAAHIVDAALHGPVHGLGVVIVIMLRSRGMQFFIAFFVVSLLEKDVGADTGIL